MKTKLYFFSATILFMVLLSAFQFLDGSPFIKKLKDSLRLYEQNFPQEKIYLQLDKTIYKPGEDIWINAFILNSKTHRPTTVSDVAYVELIDPKGNVASRLELPVIEGTVHGDFALLPTAPGGLYKVRAYTNWMKNFGDENTFSKQIQVHKAFTPRLLLNMDFQKESYGPGELVSAELTITNLKNEKVKDATVRVTVQTSGQTFLTTEVISDRLGVANIIFRLADTLATADGLLHAVVSSQGVEESITRSIPIVLNKVTVQFFPEGGRWVEGVASRVGFKALNEFGKSADIEGVIVDENDQLVTRFTSFHMGMGAFEIVPRTGTKYFARIDNLGGNHPLIPLPEADPAGLTLNLAMQEADLVEWRVNSPSDFNGHLVGQSHGEIYYGERVRLNAGNNLLKVSTQNFPAGIAVFTLFDADGVEQCERLIFLNRHQTLTIQLKTEKEKYLPREQVNLDVTTVDDKGNPVPSKISLAVVDDQLISFADDKQDNILSSMLLSTELRGEVEEPSFYFDPEEPKAEQAMDYLLMTQGWRRFTWKQVADNNLEITYSPEKNKNLAGMLLDGRGAGVAEEVTLLELGGKKRIIKVQTASEGYFMFKNIDPTIPLLLLAPKAVEIRIIKEGPFSASFNDKRGAISLPFKGEPGQQVWSVQGNEVVAPAAQTGSADFSLGLDVQQLTEVVVTAQGIESSRRSMGYSSTIKEPEIWNVSGSPSLENILQGRVAGVMITPNSGNAGSAASVAIRGVSSLNSGRGEPLYVIDGHPIGSSLNQNFSNGSFISPDAISSIEVIQSPVANVLYGSAAANGVIQITTHSRFGYYHFPGRRKSVKYSSMTIRPRKFSTTREFYIPPSVSNQEQERNDFRTTVFWSHTIVTDEKGEARVSFQNNDATSAFRITAEGFSKSGLLGRNEEVYYTELPLSLDAKFPDFLGYEDTLRLPLRVKNESPSAITADVSITLPRELHVEGSTSRKIRIEAGLTETVWFTIVPLGVEGEFPILLRVDSKKFTDELKHTIKVNPIGFPMRLSFSYKDLVKTISFTIRDSEKNSLTTELVAFPDLLDDLFAGAEAILREPYGCFEQVSSSNFPNILALQYMRQSGMINPDAEQRALTYLSHGYNKLAAYEIKSGGFEWYGSPPAHEGLTAYGLIQFHELKKVYSGVNEAMVKRTRDWLMDRRNGHGGFKQHAGKYGFAGASEHVTDAYILYALSETGTTDLESEYANAFAEAMNSKDMYRMALMANTAFNLGHLADYNSLIGEFKEKILEDGYQFRADHSIVRSYGQSLQIEIISLWTTALLKDRSPNLGLIKTCIDKILAGRAYGRFGSTQSTAMALKALTEYASIVRTTRDDGEIHVYTNQQHVKSIAYEKNTRGTLRLTDLINDAEGHHSLQVRFEDTDEPLPYSVNVEWYTKQPQSDEHCNVALVTSLSESNIKLNSTVRLTVSLRNKVDSGLPSTVAIIGIPAGLSVQPWQLKELHEKGVFDFYEMKDGNLVLYYRELAPRGNHIIDLDLKAEIPGTYLGRASSAYLYYADEEKTWVEGNAIMIQ